MRFVALALIASGLLAEAQDACRVITVAGSPIAESGDEGQATDAEFANVAAVSHDLNGNLLIAGDRKIRIVAAGGIIRTIAGDGQHGNSGDGGPAVQARFRSIAAMRVDSLGSIYVADILSHVVRRIDPSGIIITIAGTGVGGFNGLQGASTAIQLNRPSGIAVDGSGNVFIADSGNNLVRRVEPNGHLTSVVGNGQPSPRLTEFLPAANPISIAITPWRIAFDPSGNLLVLDTWSQLSRVTGPGAITPLTNGPKILQDGINAKAVSFGIQSFEVSATGELFVEIGATVPMPSGVTPWLKLREDGVFLPVPGSSSRLVGFTPQNLPVAASRDGRLLQFSNGQLAPLAGASSAGFSGDGGPGTSARLNEPADLAADANGNLFIVDSGNRRIRKLSADGLISTHYAASDESDLPKFVSTDRHGSLYAASSGLGRVRKIDSAGGVTQLLGGGMPPPRVSEQPAIQTTVPNITGFQSDGAGNLIFTSAGMTGYWLISVDTGLIGRRAEGTVYSIVGRNKDDGALALRASAGLFRLTAKAFPLPIAVPEGQAFLSASYATDPVSGSVFYVQAGSLMRIDQDGTVHTSVSASDSDSVFATASPAVTPLKLEFNQRGDLFFTDEYHRVRVLTQARTCGSRHKRSPRR